MAVAPTGAIYKTMTIDGESSRTYGVYITGQAVYNAPQREVEMISIAGRNGQLALDKGRFENIEVTYPAGIYADTEEDFAEAVSNFRNFLCSRSGYVRIEDEYNPNEYRMGIYKSGLKVETAGHKAGEFEITFNCKPQRFLMSGESAISVSDGESIFNPTQFDASPLLMIEGYGTLNVNGYEIKIADDLVGTVRVKNAFNGFASWAKVTLPNVYALQGDDITVGDNNSPFCTMIIADVNGYDFTDAGINNIDGDSAINPLADFSQDPKVCRIDIPLELSSPPMTFHYGTANEYGESFDITLGNSNGESKTYHIEFTVSYDGDKNILFQWTGAPNDLVFAYTKDTSIACGNIDLISTATTFGHPTYIDCDLGEAYALSDNNIGSLNRYIDLGSNLPLLSAGNNLIEYDNTFTDVQIIPRWWVV